MALPSGIKLGRYEIQSPLGTGGVGEVYRAPDTRLDRTVAVKILPAHLAHNLDARSRFEREARIISSLSHPNICLWQEDHSQDIAENAVMLAVILVLVVGTVRLIGGNANDAFSATASAINQ